MAVLFEWCSRISNIHRTEVTCVPRLIEELLNLKHRECSTSRYLKLQYPIDWANKNKIWKYSFMKSYCCCSNYMHSLKPAIKAHYDNCARQHLKWKQRKSVLSITDFHQLHPMPYLPSPTKHKNTKRRLIPGKAMQNDGSQDNQICPVILELKVHSKAILMLREKNRVWRQLRVSLSD